jgi:hypothetical protein
MTSREKVLGLRARLRTLTPEDEGTAQQLQVLMAIAPLLAQAVPEDPAELDRLLEALARGALSCRSDDAPTQQVFEWQPTLHEWAAL